MLNSCNPTHATPVLHIHGVADSNTIYYGKPGVESIPSIISYWVNYNQCDTQSVFTQIAKGYTDYKVVIDKLTNASWDRVFVIYDAIKMGISLERIYEITKIDIWFLRQYEALINLEKEISKYDINDLSKELLLNAKQNGFADRQIAHMLGCLESVV